MDKYHARRVVREYLRRDTGVNPTSVHRRPDADESARRSIERIAAQRDTPVGRAAADDIDSGADHSWLSACDMPSTPPAWLPEGVTTAACCAVQVVSSIRNG